MNKHRLMLSAAAVALLAAVPLCGVALADTDLTTNTSTALCTGVTTTNTTCTVASGNITIESGASVSIKAASAAVTVNTNNFLSNEGTIANSATTSAIGVQVDTSAGNITGPTGGIFNASSISLSGDGTGKVGVLFSGGNTYFGPVTFTSLTGIDSSGQTVLTSQSDISITGDQSAAFYIVQNTQVTGNILLGGTIEQLPSNKSTTGGGVVMNLDGTVNGNVLLSATIQGVGNGIRGIQTLGGINSCATGLTNAGSAAPSGYACAALSEGALINTGSVQLIGTQTISTTKVNLESGSALVIGGSIAGGVINAGPSTSNAATAAILSSAGAATAQAPTVLIDPSQSATVDATGTQQPIRGPIIIGAADTNLDAVDPGFSFYNRGTITAQPIDNQVSSIAMVIRGASATNYTQLTGGLLNSGSITATAQTNQIVNSTTAKTGLDIGVITATAVDIGSFATVPNIEVAAEAIGNTSNTPGSIRALVTGLGQGAAYGVVIEKGATVNAINVGLNASIIASVQTTTIAPIAEDAPKTAPFTLTSEAIIDSSGTLSAINNAGTIQAANTTLFPGSNAFTVTNQYAVDLRGSDSTTALVINNSGKMLGDILFGAASNGNVLNVGNLNGVANPSTGVANTATNYAVVAESIASQVAGAPPATYAMNLYFGGGTGNQLNIGNFGYVSGVITSAIGGLDVNVTNGGILYIANTATTGAVNTNSFTVGTGGTLGLTIAQNTSGVTPIVNAKDADISGASLGLQFGSFVAAGKTAAATAAPGAQVITLISASNSLTDTTLGTQNAVLSQNIPFLFESPTETGYSGGAPLSLGTDSASGNQALKLTLIPRSTGAFNADGTAGLNLSGDAKYEFPFAAAALGNDDQLGSAIASSLTVYNNGTAASGINIAASQQAAQSAFSKFAPDVSGGARQVAIMLTDQASGPVAARQRLLRSYSDVPGEMTLWGEEFTGQINNKGKVDGQGTLTAYKDHGFGFSLGVDSGTPRSGWWGGAFTFYTGDVSETEPRASLTHTEWYMLTAYTDWKGRHVFFDTQANLAYGNFDGNRSISLDGVSRTATSKRPGLMASLGANTGVMLHYGALEVDPHVSLDGLVLREEGYTEDGGGDGVNLQVAPYYANSFRTAVGIDLKAPFSVWGVTLSPDARLGYRYDLVADAVKLKAAFASTGGLATVNNTMTFLGPDPDKGNAILGAGLGASTDTWQLGANYDWIHGDNGSVTQVGIFTLLARI